MISIRKFNEKDTKEVKELIDKIAMKIFKEPIKNWEDFSDYIAFYVAIENKKIIATIALKDERNGICKLRRMYIDENYRRKGLGTTLLKKIEDVAKKKKMKIIKLKTYTQMKGASEFYQRNGYFINSKKGDEIIMEKIL